MGVFSELAAEADMGYPAPSMWNYSTNQTERQDKKPPMPRTLRDAALWYADMGFPVFPLQGKVPCAGSPGFYAATTDKETIMKMWEKNPYLNIGIRGGNGVVILDVDMDRHKGKYGDRTLDELEAQYGKLPETVTAITGGGGLHMYFKSNDSKLTKSEGFRKWLDYRGSLGYVVAPPSVNKKYNTTYRWKDGHAPNEIDMAILPEWLRELMLQKTAKTEKSDQIALQQQKAPEMILEGERNATLFGMACSLRAKGLTENAIFAAVREENRNRCRPPLPEQEVQKICSQAAKYPAGTLKKTKPATGEQQKPMFAPFEPFDAPIVPPPFPVHALPEGVIPYVREVSDFIQVSPAMVATPVLGILSTAVQGKYVVSPTPGWKEPLSTWTIATADPSERKSAALNWAKKPLIHWQAEQNKALVRDVDDWNIRAEALKERIFTAKKNAAKEDAALDEACALQAELRNMEAEAPKFIKLTCGDTTPEELLELMEKNDGRICMLSDEGGGLDTVTGRRYSKVENLDALLQAYSGSTIDTSRKTSGSIYIENPALSMCLMSQTEKLMELVSDRKNAGRGFCARFLIALPESLVGKRTLFEVPPPSDEAEKLYNLTIQNILEMGDVKNPQVIRFSDEARNALNIAFNEMEKELPDLNSDTKSWGGKFIGTAARVAAIFHLCHYGNAAAALPVEEWTVRNAVTVMRYFRECAEIVFGGGTEEPETVKDALYIWNRIKKSGVEAISKGKLQHDCKRFKRVSEMEAGLKELEKHGYIGIDKQVGKGRPSITIYRNPVAD